MKIVFTTKGSTWESKMDARFGRTEYFLIYDEEKDELLSYDNKDIDKIGHGAGPKTVQKLMEYQPNILITGNGPGEKAGLVLKNTNVDIYIGAGNMTAKEAYEAYKNNKLDKF